MVSRLPQRLFLFPKSRQLQIHNLLWELFRNRILNQEAFPVWKHPGPQIADAWDAYQTTTGTNPAKEQEIWAEIDSDWYIGILTIPTLQVEVPIFSEYVFDQLPYTPCRYAGSYLTDNMIVAAHNYDSHFGRIRKLDSGDPIDFTDVTGTVYHYQVIQTEILPDTAVEEMEQGNWDLTLFTCTLSGTQRVTVRCERIS